MALVLNIRTSQRALYADDLARLLLSVQSLCLLSTVIDYARPQLRGSVFIGKPDLFEWYDANAILQNGRSLYRPDVGWCEISSISKRSPLFITVTVKIQKRM